MSRRDWTRTALITVLLLIVVLASSGAGFAAGWYLKARTSPSFIADENQIRQYFNIQWEALRIIEQEFNRDAPLDLQQLARGAVAGMVQALGDPYTVYVPPEEARIFEQDLEGSFDGIGATVDIVDGYLVIIEPLEGSPAATAGLQAGDVVLQADGKSMLGLDLMEAISLIRGPKGTQVTLLIQRQGVAEPFEVRVTRDKIDLPTVSYRELEDSIAYIRLTEFNSQATTRLQTALREAMARNPRAIIFDLRGNPGGYLHIAVQVASEFVRSGVIVTERDAQGKNTEYKAQGDGLALDVPLVVLVDGGSASAAEIVAGAIQENGRGILVGSQTYGKGSVQTSHTLSDGSAVRVSIARWYTPLGHQIDGRGLTPDITVEPEAAAGRDVALERALEHLKTAQQPTPIAGS